MTAYRENLKAGVFDQLAAEDAEERGEDLDPVIAERLGAQEDDDAAEGYAGMTIADLRPLASEREIEGRSAMDKDELVAALEAWDEEHADNE